MARGFFVKQIRGGASSLTGRRSWSMNLFPTEPSDKTDRVSKARKIILVLVVQKPGCIECRGYLPRQ